ncbi:16290_t:CDS:1, partial [Dentiscutata heterogama]
MLHHNIQQKLPELFKKKSKKQTLSTLSTSLTNITDIENSNNDLLFEKEFKEELLKFDIKAVSIDIKDELMIEEFFNM